MTQTYVEREVKWDVDETFRLPAMGDLVPDGGSLNTVVVNIDSVYFDTAQSDLAKAHVTLRRREGEPTDSGWQLKLPIDDARVELRVPANGVADIPAELRSVTAGLRRGRLMRQVARIRTTRTAHRFFDATGELLLEVADDRVFAATLGAKTVVSTWREVEVELGNDDGRLADAISDRLTTSGARTAERLSKLDRATAEPGPPPVEHPAPAPSTLGALAMDYLSAQRHDLQAGDLRLRRGSADVHDIRVAARRIRSTLRTYGVAFDTERVTKLDGELRWYAALLGAVRDPDVLREHLRSMIADLPEQLVFGPVAERVEQELLHERDKRLAELRDALDSARYFAMLEDVDSWVADPPMTAGADRPSKDARAILDTVRDQLKRQLRAVASGKADTDQVHSTRKAAKRIRYSVELAAPTVGDKEAKRQIAKLKTVQDTLGEFQDSVVATDLLLELGNRAVAAGENAFTYGLLYALQQQRAAVSRAKVSARSID